MLINLPLLSPESFSSSSSRWLATLREDVISDSVRSWDALHQQPSLVRLHHQISFRPSKLYSRPRLAAVRSKDYAISPWCVVKEKDRDWGLNRGLSGSVPHKNTINNINHPAPQIRSAACWTKGRVSLTCHPRVTGQ